MNREKFAWLVSIGMIAVLCFQIPGTLATRDDDYSFVRTLVDIHRQVAANYVEPVSEDDLREGAINGMLGQLDPFSIYVPPMQQESFDRMLEGSFKGVGIQLDQKEGGPIEVLTPIDGSPAFKAGVMAGDIILKVNGETIENMRIPDVVKKITGKIGTDVTLTVRHTTGEEADLKMQREEIVLPTVKGYERKQDGSWNYYCCDDPKIAYVRIVQFTQDTFPALKEVMDKLVNDGMRGLIMDLRFNPGGHLGQAIETVDMFVDKGVIVSTRGRNRPEQIVQATGPGTLPYFPMIVIVNEHSASASEIVAGSLMDNKRALVIGERSYGKGSVQEVIPLDGKSGELKLTVAYYYLPSGRLVHKKKDATDWGVQPQIVVPMDPAAEQKAMKERYDQELSKRPVPKSTTKSVLLPATTQVTDVQLQRSIDTMVALVVLTGDQGPAALTEMIPATKPTTVASSTTRKVVPESPDATENPDSIPGAIEQKISPKPMKPKKMPAPSGAITRPSTTRPSQELGPSGSTTKSTTQE